MKNHKLYKVWDQVPVTYYQDGTKKNILQRIWHTHKANKAKEIIKSLTFTNCLDLGCASGFMLNSIAKAFPKRSYVGADVYDKAIQYAKKKYKNIKFVVIPSKKLPFKTNKFDLVTCYETIEHVEDPKSTLREIKRILKKGGTCILAMDSGSLLFRLVWYVWEKTKGKVWDGAHLHPFHHDELEKIIKSVGFRIKDKKFSHFGMEVIFVLGK